MVANGKLPADSLVALSTPGRLLEGPAASFERLLKATGTKGTTKPSHAYRSYAEQVAVFTLYYSTDKSLADPNATVGNGGIKRWDGKTWYRKKGKPTAAIPGTSNHGLGKAVDFQGLVGYGSPIWKAFAKEAVEHGWDNAEGEKIGEYWHWVYIEANDKHKNDGKDEGMDINDTIKLSPWMKEQLGDSDTITVAQALGYTAAGTVGTEKNTTKMLAEQVKQTALLVEIRNLLKNPTPVKVDIPSFVFTGTATPKDQS